MKKTLFLTLVLAALQSQAAARIKTPPKPKVDPIGQAHERIKDFLKDPDSAKFRSEFIGKDGAVCGFVNAKNSYGGYGGFKAYIVDPERVIIESEDRRELWKLESRWTDLCSEFEPVGK